MTRALENQHRKRHIQDAFVDFSRSSCLVSRQGAFCPTCSKRWHEFNWLRQQRAPQYAPDVLLHLMCPMTAFTFLGVPFTADSSLKLLHHSYCSLAHHGSPCTMLRGSFAEWIPARGAAPQCCTTDNGGHDYASSRLRTSPNSIDHNQPTFRLVAGSGVGVRNCTGGIVLQPKACSQTHICA